MTASSLGGFHVVLQETRLFTATCWTPAALTATPQTTFETAYKPPYTFSLSLCDKDSKRSMLLHVSEINILTVM